jgi:hypothetical protein
MSEAHMNGSESSQSDESTSEGAISDPSQLIDLVRERPWACLLGAAALGFVLARFVRGGR